MMTETRKTELESQLNQMIMMLKEAQKSLFKGQYIHAAIFVGNVSDQLPTMRMMLARG
ncbi:hypothetical protein [Haemophilus paraphrohaemolyticus]|uniref:Uncharacterized protein n=1 Tax=Haemophilus paraphrohaemolyticus HK411 TaxID=1095743 RepID=I2NI74_9PAST|nr:hypothetical protein [Haemophilus paraphrohaemolyticus]EIG25535.1 hypothetical protein HMPREF1054_1952 [Haemophilus paraphrohaemolyticus HK411]STP01056.1 Uncharacterised protein [Haemophilus paraphrohaemolyticus]